MSSPHSTTLAKGLRVVGVIFCAGLFLTAAWYLSRQEPQQPAPLADDQPASGHPSLPSVSRPSNPLSAPNHRAGQSLQSGASLVASRLGATPIDAPTPARAELESLKKGELIELPAAGGGTVQGEVQLVLRDTDGWLRIGGILPGRKGNFFFNLREQELNGQVILPEDKVAVGLETQPDGSLVWLTRPIGNVVCSPYAAILPPPSSGAVAAPPLAADPPVPVLNSRPSATGVIYIDFDGETVVDPSWNGGQEIVAPHPGMSETQITSIWSSVADKFLPFNVNVTTDSARYDQAPVGRRMRCIISSNDFGTGAGGIAYLNSWRLAGAAFSRTIPCWVFATSSSPEGFIVIAIAHEIGHTFGLRHDGFADPPVEYHPGWRANVATTSDFPLYRWQPIMGGGGSFSTFHVFQWSRGEYTNASNTEDDVAIISGTTNQIGFSTDEDSTGTPNMGVDGSFDVRTVFQSQTDVDQWIFGTRGGNVRIVAGPTVPWGTADVQIEIRDDSTGSVVAQSNVLDTINIDFTTNLPAGRYRVAARPAANGPGLTFGYPVYGSIGEVRVQATYPAILPAATATLVGLFPHPSGYLPQGATDRVLGGFSISASDLMYLSSVVVQGTGTATAADLTNVRLIHDEDRNGAVNGTEASIAGPVAYSNSMTFTVDHTFVGMRWYLVTANVQPAATTGRTVSVSVANGAISSTAVSQVGSAPGQVRTLGTPAAPTIQDHPTATQTIATNTSVTLSVNASGFPAPQYQWYAGESGNTSAPVANATSATYVTPALTVTSRYWVRVSNAEGSADSTSALIQVVNADLAGLTTNRGPLQPLFSSGQTAYSITVPGNIDTITLTPTVAQPGSTVTVNNVATPSGTASAPVSFPFGTRFIPVTVTSQLGLTTKTYMLEITRLNNTADLASLSLTTGPLSPAFDSLVTNYSANVPFSSNSTRVIAGPVGSGATIRVNGKVVLANFATGAIPLAVGPNTITIGITSQEGSASKTYAIQINRFQDSSLASLSADQASLQPPFSPSTLTYQAVVPFETSQLSLAPVPSDADATVLVAGAAPANPVPLSIGANSIPILVNTNDGSSTTYNLSVTRRANPALASLGLSSGQLQPEFSPAQTSYNVTVPYSVDSLRITPIAAAAGAQLRLNNIPVLSGQLSSPIPLTRGPNTLTIVCTAPDNLATRTYSIQVTRTSPEIELRSNGTSLNSASAPISMGIVPPGTSVTREITVHNLGSEALTNLAVTVISPGHDSFQASLPVDTLAPGDEVPIVVTFSPATLGPVSCQLSIASSDPDENPTQLQLTGAADYRGAKSVELPDWPLTQGPPVNSPWLPSYAGSYQGLIRRQGASSSLLGFVSAVVSPAASPAATGGLVSVNAQFDGREFSFRGELRAASGRFEATLPHPGGGSVGLGLQLMRQSATDSTPLIRITLIATTTGRRLLAEAELLGSAYHARRNPVPASLVGRYTLLLPSTAASGVEQPGGDGWATLFLAKGGTLTATGALGDGTRITMSAPLSAQNSVFLFNHLYRSAPERGRVGGKLFFRTAPGTSDCDGAFSWIKFEDSRELRYAKGFELQLAAVGSAYRPPARGQSVLAGLKATYPNAELSLIGPSLSSATVEDLPELRNRVLSWTTTHRLIHYGPEQLSGEVIPETGEIKGSYTDPNTNLKFPLSGVVLQNQERAGGHFIDPNAAQSGAMRIVPGTDLSFPGSEDPGALRLAAAPPSPIVVPSPVPSRWTSQASTVGSFSGLLHENGQPVGALDNVILTATGGVTGTLWLDGVAATVRGSFAEDGTARIPVKLGSQSLELRLILNSFPAPSNTFVLAGSLNAGTSRTISGEARNRPAFTRSAPSPLAGTYTVAFRAELPVSGGAGAAPNGDSYATLGVNQLGVCTAQATLSDGTKATWSSPLGAAVPTSNGPTANWTFYQALRSRSTRTQLAGELHFRHVQGVSHLDGSCRWGKQVVPRSPVGAPPVPQFALTLPAVGSRFTPAATGVASWPDLPPGPHNIWVRLHGPGLSGATSTDVITFSRAATWTPGNRIIYYGPEGLSLTFAPASGVISGSLKLPSQGINATFGGVLLQEQKLATGFYRNGSKSGLLSITERP